MTYEATVLKVMIASPEDVPAARESIRAEIHEWNAVYSEYHGLVLAPVSWESHASPRMGKRAQEIINEQALQDCDLLVAVFWTRLGSPTGDSPSGTVEEINRHLDEKKPAMIYFSYAPVVPESIDVKQWDALKQFRQECEEKGLIERFESIEEFRRKFRRQLMQTLFRDFSQLITRQVKSPEGDGREGEKERQGVPPISDAARELLLEAANDKSGIVMRIRTMSGISVSTNGREFAEGQGARAEARWEGAVDELASLELIVDRAHKGEVYWVTSVGYDTVDLLRQGF